jgi:hypothetical protein
MGFHQRGAALDPVAVVAVHGLAIAFDLGVVDVAAHEAVDPAPFHFVHAGLLEDIDMAGGPFYATLQPTGQRPIGQPHSLAEMVDPAAHVQQQVIGLVADQSGKPAAFHHVVELVTVHQQQASAVGCGVDVAVADTDVTESKPVVVAQRMIVVAGHIDDRGPGLGLVQDGAHDVVVRLGPIQAAFHVPEVDDIPEQVQVIALDGIEKVEQVMGLAVFGAQVDVGDPDAAVMQRSQLDDWRHRSSPRGGARVDIVAP